MIHPRSLALDERRPPKTEWVCTACKRVVPFDHECKKKWWR